MPDFSVDAFIFVGKQLQKLILVISGPFIVCDNLDVGKYNFPVERVEYALISKT